jgi:hypothetical protein
MEGTTEPGKVTTEAPKGNDPVVQPTAQVPATSGLDNGTVYDLKDVPPNADKQTLEYHQKKMQAEYTRRTQKLSEREKASVALEQKAKAWDSALNLPKVKQALMEAAGQSGTVDEPQQPGEIDSVDKILAEADRRHKRGQNELLARLEPILQGLAKENRDLRRQAVSKELPEFEKYRDDIDRLLSEKPNLTEREAYVLASHEDQVLNAERRALDNKRQETKRALDSMTEGGDEPRITDELLASIPAGASMEEIARRMFAGTK